MSRAGACSLVGLLLVGGCGGKVEGPDGCGTGRPRWVPVPAPEGIDMEFHPAQFRDGPSYSVVWDGKRFLFWGGYRREGGRLVPAAQGAAYSPEQRRWEPLVASDRGRPLGFAEPARAEHWARGGNSITIVGGVVADPERPEGVRWHLDFADTSPPGDNVWEPRTVASAPPGFEEARPTIVLFGGLDVFGRTESGEEFGWRTAIREDWTPLPTPGWLSEERTERASTSAGESLVFGSRQSAEGDRERVQGVYRFNPPTWADMPIEDAPSARTGHTLIDGAVWGGEDSSGLRNDGAWTYAQVFSDSELADKSWHRITTEGAPTARKWHAATEIFFSMLVFGGRDMDGWLNDGGLYDQRTDTWQPLPDQCAPPPLEHPVAVPTREPRIRRPDGYEEPAVLVWGTRAGHPGEGAGALLLLPKED